MVEVLSEELSPWQQLAATHDPALRERLLLQYMPLVNYVVGRVCASTPRGMERCDLIGVGTLGLLDAVDKFDPSRGTKFEPYAIARIRGAVIDHLRSQGTISRASLQKSRALDNATSTLQAELGRAPSDLELSRFLGRNVVELRDYLAETVPVLVSLDDAPTTDGAEGLSLADTIPDASSPNPLRVAETVETVFALGQALGALPERERLVVSLYYYDALTMREISRVMDVSESRVSQIHTQAVTRLRAHMQVKVKKECGVA